MKRTTYSMEEIHVRLTSADREQTAEALRQDLSARSTHSDPASTKVYLHAAVASDLCVHLYFNRELSSYGSEIGNRIALGLRVVGVVKHTVWHLSQGNQVELSNGLE